MIRLYFSVLVGNRPTSYPRYPDAGENPGRCVGSGRCDGCRVLLFHAGQFRGVLQEQEHPE